LRGISFAVKAGERVAILGANGSGKSTLLSCLNGLVVPKDEDGRVTIYAEDGRALNPARKDDLGEIRRCIGTVMQNPDDQIVSSVVEEDVAFGPENLELTGDETRSRVEISLKRCGLETLGKRPVRFLSGGEKQRLTLAGVLALETGVIALDEAVSMIDPAGRDDFLSLLDTLNGEGKTVLEVTHSLEEAFRCRRCLVFCCGELVFDGTPGVLLERPELESWGFVLPEPLAAIRLLSEKLPGFSVSTLDPAEAAEKIAARMIRGETPVSPPDHAEAVPESEGGEPQGGESSPAAIRCVCASHEYREDSPARRFIRGLGSAGTQEFTETQDSVKTPAIRGMENVTFTLPAGKSLALIGTSGSGKSTLLKHLNALLLPDRGRVIVMGKDTLDKKNKLAGLRVQAALSVQSPESALFEEFVADDVAFGPVNTGLSGKVLKDRVTEAMEAAGLCFAGFADRKTFSLSGGEKRRAAIAGTVAMDSPVILFDEPLAGLDGVRRRRILSMIDSLKNRRKTVIVTTHSMECAALFDFVAVMSGGTMAAFGPPREIFGPRWDPAWGLNLPWPAAVARCLVLPETPLSAAELAGLVCRHPAGLRPGTHSDFNPNRRPEDPVCRDRTASGRDLFSRPDSGPQSAFPGKNRRRKTGTEFFHTAGLGRFLDRPSALRFLPGRIKLPLFAAGMIAAIVLPSPFFPAAVLVLGLVAGTVAGRIEPGHLFRGFVSIAPWLFTMALIQQFYTSPDSDSAVILSFWKFSVSSASFLRSVSLFVRVASLTVLFSLYSAVTPLRETLEAFNAGLSVLGPFGFPSRDISLGAGIALRFIPVLTEEAERIVTAQLSRGGKKGRFRMAVSMIVPLFLRSLERSEKLAKAVALRLYGYKNTKNIVGL
jgi:energy-coupling factor transport system ATP-binding protein